ncbi:hypothetical protein [Nocardia bovistercoris]|uniref:Uncharacterized protein n=1 Tax=Nocardia bovistercoris TaxID=2785916 RepID=A0A931N5H6_9NOCA|nr:hypothetical protein [Nocardia bovistercoris]MBH0779854.1 hypothetical protein [Nocardia bovistercoris]
MGDDVGKSWNDDGAFRRAGMYVLGVIAVAGVVAVVAYSWADRRESCAGAEVVLCDNPSALVVVLVPALVLLGGGIGAFVRTYLVWRDGGSWPVWQGAGWFLFVLMVVYLSIGGGVGAS